MGDCLAAQTLRMFVVTDLLIGVGLTFGAIGALHARWFGTSPDASPRRSGTVSRGVVLFTVWGVLAATGRTVVMVFGALASLQVQMRPNLPSGASWSFAGLDAMSIFLLVYVATLVVVGVIAVGHARAGETAGWRERGLLGVTLAVVAILVAFAVREAEAPVQIGAAVLAVAGVVTAMTGRRPPRTSQTVSPTLGALLLHFLSVGMLVSAIGGPSSGVGRASSLSSVAWIAPLTTASGVARPEWAVASAKALRDGGAPVSALGLAIVIAGGWFVVERARRTLAPRPPESRTVV